MTRNGALLTAAAVAAILPVMTAGGPALPQQLMQVFVTNFPETQKVEGEVSVKGPLKMTSMVRLKDVMVPPVNPRDTFRLISGGIIETDGFAGLVLSLNGQLKAELFKPGSVGAVLLPEEEPVIRALDERGEMPFKLEVSATTSPGASPYFASNQPYFRIGFPRYRVLFYNTNPKTVSVNLYAYLVN